MKEISSYLNRLKFTIYAISFRLRMYFLRFWPIATSHIYVDSASVTTTDCSVLKAYVRASKKYIANPSSLHALGVLAKKGLEDARSKVAGAIFAHPDELVFCGSGTEANNLAILGTIHGLKKVRNCNYSDLEVLVSGIEHVSVLGPVQKLEELGVKVIKIPVLSNGSIDIEFLEKNITDKTALISVMMVNNEIGVILPISEIAKIVRKVRKDRESRVENNSMPLFFHTDASQAFLYKEIDTRKMGVDLITVDSHKIYGPRGLGLLWVKRNLVPILKVAPYVVGGHQEFGLRAGTEAVPTIVAFAHAIELGNKRRADDTEHVTKLRDYFVHQLKNSLDTDSFKINGDGVVSETVIPHILSVTFKKDAEIDHEELLFRLDSASIYVSTKSSCQSDEDESYVLKQIGVKSGAIRFSFSKYNSKRQIARVVRVLVQILEKHY